jgi:hypothetical protein
MLRGGKLKDLLGQLYNGFLLRDVLGYVVPGAFVLGCVFHLLSVITNTPLTTIYNGIPDKALIYFFLICLCYICGHFLSGMFFHIPLFRWMFSYSPSLLPADYPEVPIDQAWSTHRAEYRKACETVGPSMQSHIERHGALVHFTGHVSASFLFTAIYISAFSIYSFNFRMLAYLTPILIVFPGVFIHYRRLLIERYYLERSAIKSATIASASTILLES